MRDDQKNEFKLLLGELYFYLKKELDIKKDPKFYLVSDEKNAKKTLGKTGFYDHSTNTIKIFITERHIKDCLRTFSHECVHVADHQNNKNDINSLDSSDLQYAKTKIGMKVEGRAYMLGNLLLRLWEDEKKAKDRKSGKKGV